MKTNVPYIRSRLSGMMFLEFLLWASWYVPLSGYMMSVLRFTGGQIGWIYATTAIGALVSPLLVGYLADRYFATERVLAVLEILGGICLLLAAQQTQFPWLMTLMVVNGLCFMPTLALCNSIVLRHGDDADHFSRIALWGPIGFVVSGWIVSFLLGGEQSGKFFYLAGGGGILMGLYSLTLPHTPPPGDEAAGGVPGLHVLKLFRDRSLLVFAACAFLITIPLAGYCSFGNAFLVENNQPKPTALMTLGQISEILVMLVMPWFIRRFGLKSLLVIGMSAWAVRYVLFATNHLPLILLGLLAHGFCYCFVFVAAFLYVNKRAPASMSASAQSLMAMLIWGLGMLAGTKLSGAIADTYAPPLLAATQQTPEGSATLDRAPWPKWNDFHMPSEERLMNLAKEPGEEPESQITMIDVPQPVIAVGPLRSLGQVAKQGLVLTRKDGQGNVLKDQEGKTVEELAYARQDLVEAMKEADANQDGIVTQAEWHTYTTHNWPPIWLWPALLAAVAAAAFRFGGRDATEAISLADEPAPTPQEEPAAAASSSEAEPSAFEASAPETVPPSPPETIPLDDGPLPGEFAAPSQEPPQRESIPLDEGPLASEPAPPASEAAPLPEEEAIPRDEPPPAGPAPT